MARRPTLPRRIRWRRIWRSVPSALAAPIDVALSQAATALGYSQLRPKQVEAVQHFLSGREVFVSLPTGRGKTTCYSQWHLTHYEAAGLHSLRLFLHSHMIYRGMNLEGKQHPSASVCEYFATQGRENMSSGYTVK